MTYTFKNTKTGKIVSVELKISEYDQYKADHPELERYIDSAPAVTFNGKTFGSLDSQTDNTFKEVLAKVGSKFPGSPLANRYNRTTDIKTIKTQQLVKKHVEKVHKARQQHTRG